MYYSLLMYTSCFKNVPTYIININRFQIKIGRPVLEGTFNKTMPILPKICASITLGIWGVRLSCQRSTYVYILMNHWIATNTTGSQCLKKRQTCSSKLHHLYTACSKYPPPARTKIDDEWSLNYAVHWTCGRWRCTSVYVLAFVLEADILSIWCKDDVTYYTFDNFRDNNCHSFVVFNDSLKCACKYCVDDSICDFKFPKVVPAHIIGEALIFCRFLLLFLPGQVYQFLLKSIRIWLT